MGWLLPSHLVLQKESFEGEDVLHLCAGLWASDVDNVSAKRDRQQTGCLHHCWYSQCARLAHKFFNTRAHTLKSDLLWFTKYISFHHITGVRCYLFGVQNDSSKKNIIEKKTYSSTTTPRATKECSKDAPGFYQPLNTQPDLPNLGLLLGPENLPDRDVANSLRFKTYPWPKQTINQPSMKPKPTLNYCNVQGFTM